MKVRVTYADEPALDLFVRANRTLAPELAHVAVFRLLAGDRKAVRVANVLYRAKKIETLGVLLATPRQTIASLNGMGRALMQALDAAVHAIDLHWMWHRPVLLAPASKPSSVQTTRPHLAIWVIYRPTTTDYPGFWVARLFTMGDDGLVAPPSSHRIRRGTFYVETTLALVRSRLPPGLHCIGRQRDDDPVIEEVWI